MGKLRYFYQFLRMESLKEIYRLVKMTCVVNPKMKVLNTGDTSEREKVSAQQLAQAVQRLILRLKGRYLSCDGKVVDYAGLRRDPMYTQEFMDLVKMLNTISLEELSPVQLKVFFLNVYNAMSIHGLAECDPLPKSVTDINGFWKTNCYLINGHVFSLDDIEHGILRGNTRHPSSLSSPFQKDDPRLAFTMEKLDPRIHFAINCGAKSCPAIRIYTEENLERALDGAVTNYLQGNTEILNEKEIRLSKIFLWYGPDFGSKDAEVLKWISGYLTGDQLIAVQRMLESDKFKIVYSDYDWVTNAA